MEQVTEDASKPRKIGLRSRLHYSIYSRPAGFRLLQAQRRVARPVELRKRRRAGEELKARLPNAPQIDPELGYRWIEPGELPGIDDIVRSCSEVVQGARAHVDRLIDAVPGRFRIAFDFLGDDTV
ncbi:MAG: hypothetical protein AAF726_18110, partial [Planctomycetota bacterium]